MKKIMENSEQTPLPTENKKPPEDADLDW